MNDRPPVSQSPRRRLWPVPLLFVVTFGPMAWARHHWLGSWTYDLGIKAQVLYNCWHGRWLESSVEVGHYLGDHVNPTFLLLVPLYGLLPFATTLIVAQCLIFAAGGWIVALLARRWLPDRDRLAPLAAAAYLFQCSAGNLILYDFHETALASTLILLAVWAFDRGRAVPGLVATLLAMGCKETGGLIGAAMGTWLVVSRKQKVLGTLLIVAGLAYSYLAMAVIMPHFRGGLPDTFQYYAHLGATPGEILRNIFARPHRLIASVLEPRKIVYVAILLLPALFVPLRNPRLLLPAIWVILPNLLSTRITQSSARWQYDAAIIPFVAVAMLQSWRHIVASGRPRWWHRRVVPATIAALLLSNANSRAFVWAGYVAPNLSRRADFDQLAAAIPDDAPLSASMNLGPHMVRRHLIDYPHLDWPADRFPRHFHHRAEYVLIDFVFEQKHFARTAPTINAHLREAGYALRTEHNRFGLYSLRANGP